MAPDWVGAPLLSPDQLRALERRTHPMGENDDPTDPVLYTDAEVEDQTMLGLRPESRSIINTFWADDGKSLWVRSTRTWTLPPHPHLRPQVQFQVPVDCLKPDARAIVAGRMPPTLRQPSGW